LATAPVVCLAGGIAKDEKAKAKQPRPFESSTAVTALGIANISAAPGFAMSAADATGAFSPSAMANAMQWDFKNPWAKWFELHSTHPLTARRIRSMNAVAKRLGVEPLYRLEIAEGSGRQYTGKFGIEVLIQVLPILGGLLGWLVASTLAASQSTPGLIGLVLIGAGLGWILQAALTYPRAEGPLRTVESLVSEEINASHISPVPCRVEGEIVGRGVPGLFWSDDLVLRDGTGFLTLQYRQPLGIFEFLFGWLKAGRFIMGAQLARMPAKRQPQREDYVRLPVSDAPGMP
jgi:hypothetical protein